MHPRRSLSYANVMSTLAVFVALGGTSYAALKITGKNIKDGTVTSRDVKNRSLLAADFRKGQLPAGPTGAQGPQGPKGETGAVDTSRFYDKEASDARFLAQTGKAADADKLDGIDSKVFGSVQTFAGSDLRPRSSDFEFRYLTGGGIYASTLPADANARSLIGRVDVPDGATIKRVDFHFLDDVDGSWDFYLTRFDPNLDFSNLFATGSSTGQSPAVRTLSAEGAVLVDNSKYSYQVRALPSQASSALALTGVRVHYTLPTG